MSYCNWSETSEFNKNYHNEEWGIPVHDDRTHFEYLMLEVMQCGLSWNIIIRKRDIFRKCFDNFNYDLIAEYTEKDIKKIIKTEGMIKSERKINAVINNAKCFQKIRKEYGSFSEYLWAFSGNKTILYEKHEQGFIPVSNGLSDKISTDMKKRGFKFLGTITVYSYLQASGVINDHDKNCPRYNFINSNFSTVKKKRFSEKNVSFFGN